MKPINFLNLNTNKWMKYDDIQENLTQWMDQMHATCTSVNVHFTSLSHSVIPFCLLRIFTQRIQKFEDKFTRIFIKYKSCIGKFPDCCYCNCLGERRWEGWPESHLCKPVALVCHVTPCCEHVLFFHECFFEFVFYFISDGWQNWTICFHQVLHEAR